MSREFSTQFVAYDTFCRICVTTEDEALAAQALTAAEDLALQVQSTLNMFDAESELSRLCGSYQPNVWTPVSPLLRDFLAQNLDFCRRTDGAFDPTVGPLIKLWDFLAQSPKIPSSEELAAACARVGYHHIRLDEAASQVAFDAPGVVIDPGASGKGFALKLAAEAIRTHGIFQAALDFGGNLFFLGGKQAEGGSRPWKIAVRDPDHTETYVGTLELENCGIATSSWYEHSFQKEGVVYHHLLDPRTGRPKPLTLKSVSILSSDAAYTDFLSTAFFMLGVERGAQLVETLRRESGAYIAYLAIDQNGEIWKSPGLPFLKKP